jgi:hypothetical protein
MLASQEGLCSMELVMGRDTTQQRTQTRKVNRIKGSLLTECEKRYDIWLIRRIF